MSAKLKELREKATKAADRLKSLGAEYNARKKDGKTGADLWPGDSRAQWDSANKDYDEATAALEGEQRDADMEARMNAISEWENRSRRESRNRPGLDDVADPDTGSSYGDAGLENRDQAKALRQGQVDRRLAFQAWASRGVPNVRPTDEHRSACERLKFDPSVDTVQLRFASTDEFRTIQRRLRNVHPDRRDQVVSELLEVRAMSALLGGDGAYLTAPGTLVRSLEIAMVEYGAILQVADTLTTETGELMSWPIGDDTSNVSVRVLTTPASLYERRLGLNLEVRLAL